jgi:anti-sigma factor RsiW
MDHKDAVRLKITEKYLLNELDPDQLDQFEEHLFDCPECALDIRAAAMFLEQSKNVLAEANRPAPVVDERSSSKDWFAWLQPAFAVPVMAVNQPQLLPWASVNIGTYGGEEKKVVAAPGKSFMLFVRIPPAGDFNHYVADLYSPSGKLEWSVTVPAVAGQDQWPIHVPGTNREAGTYSLAVHGVTATGENKDLGRTSFELQIRK